MNRKERLAFLTIAIFCFFMVGGFAQQPDRGFQAANRYAASGIDAINLTNGNVVLNLPIASLPAGRGTAPGYAVTLQYNSKLWESQNAVRDDGSPDENGSTKYTTTTINPSDQGGWSLRTHYIMKVTDRHNFGIPDVCWRGDPLDNVSMETGDPDARWK